MSFALKQVTNVKHVFSAHNFQIHFMLYVL